jgi:hypothetical protein
MDKFMNKKGTKAALGIPAGLNFTAFSMDVNQAFTDNGDVWVHAILSVLFLLSLREPFILRIARHFKLYEPLLESGIRVLRE